MVAENTTVERKTPPYAPYRSWKNLIEKLKKEQPLPTELDSSFWTRLKFSGALISVLKPTMVTLGLLNKDMTPTRLLEEFLDASEEQEKALYACLMDIAYPGYQDKLDLERMTDGQLTQFFVSGGASGETGVKARTFFLGLAKDAGKTLSSCVTTRTRRTPPVPRPAGTRRRGVADGGKDSDRRPLGDETPTDKAKAQASLMLWGLFKRLPAPGEVFTKDDRVAWTKAALTLFDLEYRLGSEEKPDGDEERLPF
jgi:hypothetical protein